MVLDTHTLLWWLSNDPALSALARDRIQACREGRGYLIISGVSLWELEWKRRLGKLALPGSVRPWLPRLRGLRGVLLEGISFDRWVAMAELDWDHRDPADRLIAATALEHDVPVLTKDRVFHADDSPVDAVW
jgi:PIN domain nuclease of toxin-antitoxin system